ncbi:hypothetical protein [Paraburkholderia kururiensis]|nr:hypothetical protein [Paraburkholderia kururiensis]
MAFNMPTAALRFAGTKRNACAQGAARKAVHAREHAPAPPQTLG